jgi:hypothetical protein
MQVSTDLPSGSRAIKEYLEGRGETYLSVNVSKEPDKAFMSELRRTDPKRYAELVRNMSRAAYAEARRAGVIPIRPLQKRKYGTCEERQAARRAKDRERKANNPIPAKVA